VLAVADGIARSVADDVLIVQFQTDLRRDIGQVRQIFDNKVTSSGCVGQIAQNLGSGLLLGVRLRFLTLS